jgi:hypothetical protein
MQKVRLQDERKKQNRTEREEFPFSWVFTVFKSDSPNARIGLFSHIDRAFAVDTKMTGVHQAVFDIGGFVILRIRKIPSSDGGDFSCKKERT